MCPCKESSFFLEKWFQQKKYYVTSHLYPQSLNTKESWHLAKSIYIPANFPEYFPKTILTFIERQVFCGFWSHVTQTARLSHFSWEIFFSFEAVGRSVCQQLPGLGRRNLNLSLGKHCCLATVLHELHIAFHASQREILERAFAKEIDLICYRQLTTG